MIYLIILNKEIIIKFLLKLAHRKIGHIFTEFLLILIEFLLRQKIEFLLKVNEVFLIEVL